MSQDKNMNLPGCSRQGNPDDQTIVIKKRNKKMDLKEFRKKISRTPFTLLQLDRLEEEFRKNNIITKKTRSRISTSINLDENFIKYWFQIRRSIQKKSWLNQGYAYIKYKSVNINLHEGLESTTSLDNLARDLTEMDLIDYEIEEQNEEIYGIDRNLEQSDPLKNHQEFDVQQLYTIDDTMEFWNLIPLPKESSAKVEDLVSTLPEETIEELSTNFEPCNDHQNQQESVQSSSFNLDDTLEYWDALSSQNVSVTSSENTSPQRIKILASWSKSSPNSFVETPSAKFELSELCNNRQNYIQESSVENSCNADDAMQYWDSLSSPYVSSTNPNDFDIILPQTNIMKLRNSNQELVVQNSLNNNDKMEIWDSISSTNVPNANTDDLVSTLPQTNIISSKLESYNNNHELDVQNQLHDALVCWDSISSPNVSNTNPDDQRNIIAEFSSSCTTSQLESYNNNQESENRNLLHNNEAMVYWDAVSSTNLSNTNPDVQTNIIGEFFTSCTTSKLESYNNNQELVVQNPLDNNDANVYTISIPNQDDLVSILPQTNITGEFSTNCTTSKLESYNNNQELVVQNPLDNNDAIVYTISIPNQDDLVSFLPQTNSTGEFSTNCTTSKLESYKNNQELVVQNPLDNNDTIVYSISIPNQDDLVSFLPQTNITGEFSTNCMTSKLESYNNNQELVVQNPLDNNDANVYTISIPNQDDLVSFLPQTNITGEFSTNSTTSKLESNNNNQELVVEDTLDVNEALAYWDSISSRQLQTNIELPSSSNATSMFKQPEPYKNNQEDLCINDDTMEFWDSLLARSIRCNKRAEDLVSTLPENEEEDDNEYEETSNVVRKSGKAPTLSGYQRYMLEKMYNGLNTLSRATRKTLTGLIGITMKQLRSWLSWRKKKHEILLKRYNEYGVDPIPAQFKRPTTSSNADPLKLLKENVVYVKDLDDFVDLSQNASPEVVNNLDILDIL